ncbi:hypothetical protein AVEN_54149-1 [Araneus ventricosus]|uniref:Uncharacterized protein n=1 Tax=Araneus ventricosus TaxID=182803 RepID=A0A4Y2BTL3_ARAVE|nr:hypothetical protein AVEN_54149-1 [Araneus ventricosus]
MRMLELKQSVHRDFLVPVGGKLSEKTVDRQNFFEVTLGFLPAFRLKASKKLTKGRDNWSVGELCQAVVLLAHFHCLCSFVFASEILEQPEDCQDTGNNNVASDEDSFEEVSQDTVEELMEKMSLIQKMEKESSCDEQKNGNSVDLPSALNTQFECDTEKFVDDDLTFTRRAFSTTDGHISDFIIQADSSTSDISRPKSMCNKSWKEKFFRS